MSRNHFSDMMNAQPECPYNDDLAVAAWNKAWHEAAEVSSALAQPSIDEVLRLEDIVSRAVDTLSDYDYPTGTVADILLEVWTKRNKENKNS